MTFSIKRLLLTLVVPFALLVAGFQSSAEIPTDDASLESGKDLFKTNCNACHKIDKDAVGPALKGVTERQSEQWLMDWIANPAKVIKSGDEHAVAMFEEFGSEMTAFPTLSVDDKLDLLAYIEAWKPPIMPPAPGTERPTDPNAKGGNSALDLILIIVLGALLLILVILLLIASLLKKMLSDKTDLSAEDKEFVDQKFSLAKVLRNSNFITIVAVIALLVGFLLVLKLFLYRIGVQHGYAPKQPIPFSHKIHAGDNKIDCNYCHTGVRKAKHANIPSVNICMNCHNTIKVESDEIKKIHDHAGYDVKTKTYDESKAYPIEWVRVHNLPDLAYFNHSQHVKVGGVECQECHVGIEEMDGYVQKTSELTMAWCIDCHRQKSIDKSNPYYERLIEFNKVHRGVEDLKVEDIGGLECSKCHY